MFFTTNIIVSYHFILSDQMTMKKTILIKTTMTMNHLWRKPKGKHQSITLRHHPHLNQLLTQHNLSSVKWKWKGKTMKLSYQVCCVKKTIVLSIYLFSWCLQCITHVRLLLLSCFVSMSLFFFSFILFGTVSKLSVKIQKFVPKIADHA